MATKRRDVGTGSVYRRESDGRWVATLELGWINDKRMRKTFTARTKADVVDKLKTARRQYETTGNIAGKTPTVAEWLHRWLDDIAAYKVTPGTLAAHRSCITQHLVPNIGHIRLDQLTLEHVIELHKTLRRTPKQRGTGYLAESAVLRAHAVLSKALTDAMRLDYIQRNVAQLADRPVPPEHDAEYLTLEQATKLLRHIADHPYGSRWAFALLTGQRQGECLGLRWAHLDLHDDFGFADVAWQLKRIGYRHGCGDPSCGRRFAGDCPQRELAVPPSYVFHPVHGALCRVRPQQRKKKLVPLAASLVAWLRRHRDEHPPGRHDLVWTRDGTLPVDPRDDYDAWIALLDECGLPRVKLHSVRHTCVSLHMSLGTQENMILQMVGHSTVAASRRYQHIDRDTALAAAVRLADALQLQPELGADLGVELVDADEH